VIEDRRENADRNSLTSKRTDCVLQRNAALAPQGMEAAFCKRISLILSEGGTFVAVREHGKQ
jgi:hypothetical protein